MMNIISYKGAIPIESITLPYHFSNGKSAIMLDIFSDKDPVPIKALKMKFNKGKFYSFMKDVEKLNTFILHNYPDYYPLFSVALGKDRISGQDVKVIERSDKIEVHQLEDLIVLKLVR
jgi:hypothetical protein